MNRRRIILAALASILTKSAAAQQSEDSIAPVKGAEEFWYLLTALFSRNRQLFSRRDVSCNHIHRSSAMLKLLTHSTRPSSRATAKRESNRTRPVLAMHQRKSRRYWQA
jgi:hypothetical protein